MEELNNEAVQVAEIKVTSSNSKNRFSVLSEWLVVITTEKTFTKLLFNVCQGKEFPPPKSVKTSFYKHLLCSRHHAIATSTVSYVTYLYQLTTAQQ